MSHDRRRNAVRPPPLFRVRILALCRKKATMLFTQAIVVGRREIGTEILGPDIVGVAPTIVSTDRKNSSDSHGAFKDDGICRSCFLRLWLLVLYVVW